MEQPVCYNIRWGGGGIDKRQADKVCMSGPTCRFSSPGSRIEAVLGLLVERVRLLLLLLLSTRLGLWLTSSTALHIVRQTHTTQMQTQRCDQDIQHSRT